MAMEDLDKVMGKNAEVKIPDLDWLSLETSDTDNIPRPMNVEIIPELQDAWNYTEEKGAALIPNTQVAVKKAGQKISSEVVQDIIGSAKVEMMRGLRGKELAAKLGSLYAPDQIKAAKEELIKVASEQGLLGNVYVDVSPYESCRNARRALGENKVRLAKYVVGQPKSQCCMGHKNGYCDEFRKKVVSEVVYDSNLFDEYTTHLKVAGVLQANESITSKENLRDSLLRKRSRMVAAETPKKKAAERSAEDIRKDFEGEITKRADATKVAAQRDRFFRSRPVLAFIQNEMLKGRMGNALREVVTSKFSSKEINEFAPEIRRAAELQGLLGNVYVDVSYYENADEAINGIKCASTSPAYIVQTWPENEFDDTLQKVASATGCSILPRDGKIDTKIAMSYIDDLQFNDRLSSEKAEALRKALEANQNILAVLRDAFLSSLDHKRVRRQGGVSGFEYQGETKKYAKTDNLRAAVYKALGAGHSLDSVESRVASYVSMPEAVGMTRSVLASLKEVDADSLSRCHTEKYQLSPDVRIKKATKCGDCIHCTQHACAYLGIKFAGQKDLDKPYLDLDPKTAKVQLDENPDVSRADVNQEYDMSDSFGSGMNIALNKMRGKDAKIDVNLDFSTEGLDGTIQ